MAKKSPQKKSKQAPKKAAKKAVKKAVKKTIVVAKKTVAKKVAEKPKAVAEKPVSKPKRKPNPAFMKALVPSAALAEIVGKNPLPRTEIIKQIWNYIRANGLQDQINKRMINADAKLKVVFGGKEQISMFELAKIVGAHVSNG